MSRPRSREIFWFDTKKPRFVPMTIPPFINRPDQESPEIVSSYLANEIFDSKSVLDRYSPNTLFAARKKLDYEQNISNSHRRKFINRAAFKLMEIDHMVNLIGSVKEHPRFVDICGGPGGFTEYMLWKTNSRAKGWGITLKTNNNLDWNLGDMRKNKIDTSRFSFYYGREKNGDITSPSNMSSFIEYVTKKNYKRPVEIALADGAFAIPGEENKQEQLTWHLIFCELLISISVLAPGGNIVCKFFDCFSERSVQLIYLISTYFRKIAIVKPKNSRASNSEKYVFFQDFKGNAEELLLWMANVANHLHARNDLTLLPWNLLGDRMAKIDKQFYEWFYGVNNELAENQNQSLSRLLDILSEMELKKALSFTRK